MINTQKNLKGHNQNWHHFSLQRYEMRPYGLRQSIRCPKKYGETIKERKYLLAPAYDLHLVWEQKETDHKKPLDDRYIRNAAALPDLLDLPHSNRVVTTEEGNSSDELMIHGFTVRDYQQIYHSVVDPLLFKPCGKLAAYSLDLGHTIKENLFRELAYPMLQMAEHPKGKVEVMERFCLLRPTPCIDIDHKWDL